jgi:chemotaxis protein CheD
MGTMMNTQVKVGISDYKITQPPNHLMTIGLGSCVGIALYEPTTKIGGLIHIMLPESKGFKDTTKWMKFADLAVPKVVEELKEQSKQEKIIAKIAGGASMFSFGDASKGQQIGERNVLAVKKHLDELGIPILADHTGGKMGRTMFVDLETFEVRIRMVNREEFVL